MTILKMALKSKMLTVAYERNGPNLVLKGLVAL